MLDNRKFKSKNQKKITKKTIVEENSINYLSFDKLIYHPEKLTGFKVDENIFPITATLSLGNYCNHGCLWCSTAYWRQDDSNSIDFKKIIKWLAGAKKKGLKGVGYVGNGEPLAYKQFSSLIKKVNKLGLDQGVFTNGYLINRFEDELLSSFTYIRISLDAGSKEIHSSLHDVSSSHFDKIVKNLKSLLIKRKNKNPTVGVQFATHQRNIFDLEKCVKISKDIGVDYVSVKPVFDRGSVHEKIEKNSLNAQKVSKIIDKLRKYESNSFKIFFREHQFESENLGYNILDYDRCYAGYFGVNIYEDGVITGCGPHHIPVGDLDTSFDVLEKNIVKVSKNLDLSKCPAGCRFHPMNRLLHKLKNKDIYSKKEHINLI